MKRSPNYLFKPRYRMYILWSWQITRTPWTLKMNEQYHRKHCFDKHENNLPLLDHYLINCGSRGVLKNHKNLLSKYLGFSATFMKEFSCCNHILRKIPTCAKATFWQLDKCQNFARDIKLTYLLPMHPFFYSLNWKRMG